MQSKAANELDCRQDHGLETVAIGVIFVSKGDGAGAGVQCAQTSITDGYAVSVTPEIIQHVVRSHDRAFGEDYPALSLEFAQELGKGSALAKRLKLAVELEFCGGVELEQSAAELALEHLGNRPHREQPASLLGPGPGILNSESATGDQAMEVGMVHEVLAPGMEDGGEAQLGAEMFLAKLQESGAGTLEEQPVERGGVLQSQRAQFCRKGEDPMEIAHGQQRAALMLQPLKAALMLAGWAVAIAAAVGPPVGAVAVLASPDRPAQLNGSTPGQTTQDFKLVSWDAMAGEVFGQEYLEDLCDRQLRRMRGSISG